MNRKNLMISKSLWDLPTSTNMTYFWNFGFMLGFILMLQMMSGFMLTMFYSALYTESFNSIMNLMKETWMGWFIRLTHMNTASMLFMVIFMHLFRGMFFSSNSNKKTWVSGMSMMMMIMMISFLGYVLPWGQMSYWAVAVITNLLTIVPVVGLKMVQWIWGGFSVGKSTLMRFYSLHFILPFLLTIMILLHILMLHKKGSSNSIGANSNMDKMNFHPYFSTKDLMSVIVGMMMLTMIISFSPMITLDPINNVPANPMQTPLHIQPEWYFLPFYAILRAMPSKTSGVVMLISSVMIFMILPIYKFKMSTKFMMYRKMKFWSFISSIMILMKMGSLEAEEPFIFMSKIWTMTYFSLIILMNT